MMLIHNQMEYKVDFTKAFVNSLIIESPLVMRSFVKDLSEQVRGGEGGFVLSESHLKELDISKKVELIINPIIEIEHAKRFSSKILNSIKEIAVNETNYLKTSELQTTLLQYAAMISHELISPVSYSDEIDVAALLKVFNFSLDLDDLSVIENIVTYITALNTYLGISVFVFINLKDFILKEELVYLAENVKSLNSNLLLIESGVNNYFIDDEKYCIIDTDLCEIFREGN